MILNQVKQKLHLVGYLLTRYFNDARYHERKIQSLRNSVLEKSLTCVYSANRMENHEVCLTKEMRGRSVIYKERKREEDRIRLFFLKKFQVCGPQCIVGELYGHRWDIRINLRCTACTVFLVCCLNSVSKINVT